MHQRTGENLFVRINTVIRFSMDYSLKFACFLFSTWIEVEICMFHFSIKFPCFMNWNLHVSHFHMNWNSSEQKCYKVECRVHLFELCPSFCILVLRLKFHLLIKCNIMQNLHAASFIKSSRDSQVFFADILGKGRVVLCIKKKDDVLVEK